MRRNRFGHVVESAGGKLGCDASAEIGSRGQSLVDSECVGDAWIVVVRNDSDRRLGIRLHRSTELPRLGLSETLRSVGRARRLETRAAQAVHVTLALDDKQAAPIAKCRESPGTG